MIWFVFQNYKPTGDWYVKVPAEELPVAFKRNMQPFGAKPIQMLTIKNAQVVKEKTEFPYIAEDTSDRCVVISNCPLALKPTDSKTEYVRRFFR